MYEYIKKSLHSKILILIIGTITFGVVVSILLETRQKEQELIEEKLRASRFIARPLLNAIYDDMLEERADMARHLINDLSAIQGIELQIIRSNGTEEAFKDYKTVDAVRKVYGRVLPEWVQNHPDEQKNTARDVGSPEFRKAYDSFKADWSHGPVYYIEKQGGEKSPYLFYLQPIEKKASCGACHSGQEARGILMIKTPLAGMYDILSETRTRWVVSGLLAIALSSVLLSIVIRRSITGPINMNVGVIKRIIDENRGYVSERVKVTSEDEVGYLASAFNNMLDALERKAEENRRLFEQVAKSKEEWEATFDAIHDLILICDRGFRIIKVNKALAMKLNASPGSLIGRPCHEVLCNRAEPEEAWPRASEAFDAKARCVEADNLTIEGRYEITTFPVFNDEGEVWANVNIMRDVTQEKLLREQLLHSEKLSTVGKLVAGIAHELNNPLMGIMGFSQILMDMPGDKRLDEVKDKLRKVYHESLRTSKIVQNLLTFARTKKAERDYVDINEIIRHTCELREYSLKSNNIKVALNLEKDLPRTMADLYQLQQVFINVMNNAEDAMVAHRKGGSLEITTKKLRGKIALTFRDSGPGIPAHAIHKVFDPFFTTKEVGKGTGLGLSITHGIVTEHGGTIDVACPEEGGTVVTIELPVIEKELWGEIKEAVENRVVSPRALSVKNVLIVDDEKSIREALADILKRKGFVVDVARDGQEALELLEKGRYALLLTDVKMPTLSGIDLYEAVLRDYQYLKDRTVIITGDVFSQDIKEFLARNKCPYILKPFVTKELMTLINQVLSAPEQPGR